MSTAQILRILYRGHAGENKCYVVATYLAVPVIISTPSLVSWSVTTSVSAASTFRTLF